MALNTLIGQIANVTDLLKQTTNNTLSSALLSPVMGALPWDQPVPLPKPKPQKRFTKYQMARKTCQEAAIAPGSVKTNWYIRRIDTGLVIETFGALPPLRDGRPAAYAQHLLNGVPSPIGGSSHDWKSCGLMYYTPYIIGNRKSRARTSLVGLALLKHWAVSTPAFEPFYACYVTEKAEREISNQVVDLFLGVLPTPFLKAVEANERILKHKQEKLALEEQQRRDASHTYSQQMAQYQAISQSATNPTGLGVGPHSHSLNGYAANSYTSGNHTHSLSNQMASYNQSDQQNARQEMLRMAQMQRLLQNTHLYG